MNDGERNMGKSDKGKEGKSKLGYHSSFLPEDAESQEDATICRQNVSQVVTVYFSMIKVLPQFESFDST